MRRQIFLFKILPSEGSQPPEAPAPQATRRRHPRRRRFASPPAYLPPMEQILLQNHTEGILTLTLNRPNSYNAFTRPLALQLQQALEKAHTDSTVRCVVLTGEGKAFCAGQDLQELVGPDAPAMGQILKEHFNPIVTKIRNCAKPVIAAVNGVAAGAGANIAIACDIVLASDNASFIQAFSKIGLIPDSGGTWTLPRIIGWQKASALMMTGDKLSADEAERLGLVYRVIPAADFQAEVAALAHKLANMPTQAFTLTKQALNASATNTFTQQLTLEDQLQFAASETSDYAEGVAAFLEKRQANFTGK